MKRILTLMVLTFVALGVIADDADNGTLNERFYQAKLQELVQRLSITSNQKAKFEPMYRDYCEEMTALWASRKQPISATSSSSKAAAIEKRKMEMQQRAQGIRMKYIDKFATVLTANQVERFFEVESAIQKKLKERKEQARGQ